MSSYEFEVKYLGGPEDLRKLSEFILNRATAIHFSRSYTFVTKYYDANKAFEKKGFSLRSRDDSEHYASSVELKQLRGTKRLELTQRNGSFNSSYFNLLSRKDYPKELPKLPPGALSQMFEISTTRKEVGFDIYGYSAELCLDYVKHANRVEHELEIEFKGISARQFFKISKQLTKIIDETFPLVKATKLSKAQRSLNYLNFA